MLTLKQLGRRVIILLKEMASMVYTLLQIITVTGGIFQIQTAVNGECSQNLPDLLHNFQSALAVVTHGIFVVRLFRLCLLRNNREFPHEVTSHTPFITGCISGLLCTMVVFFDMEICNYGPNLNTISLALLRQKRFLSAFCLAVYIAVDMRAHTDYFKSCLSPWYIGLETGFLSKLCCELCILITRMIATANRYPGMILRFGVPLSVALLSGSCCTLCSKLDMNMDALRSYPEKVLYYSQLNRLSGICSTVWVTLATYVYFEGRCNFSWGVLVPAYLEFIYCSVDSYLTENELWNTLSSVDETSAPPSPSSKNVSPLDD